MEPAQRSAECESTEAVLEFSLTQKIVFLSQERVWREEMKTRSEAVVHTRSSREAAMTQGWAHLQRRSRPVRVCLSLSLSLLTLAESLDTTNSHQSSGWSHLHETVETRRRIQTRSVSAEQICSVGEDETKRPFRTDLDQNQQELSMIQFVNKKKKQVFFLHDVKVDYQPETEF